MRFLLDVCTPLWRQKQLGVWIESFGWLDNLIWADNIFVFATNMADTKSMMEVITEVLRSLEMDWKATSLKIISSEAKDASGYLE